MIDSRIDAFMCVHSRDIEYLLEASLRSYQQHFPDKGNLTMVTDNPAAECTRCHTIRGRGSDVGPELTHIGSTLTRPQLVEALVTPNARIAPGFGTVSVTLKSGEKIDGTLRSESDTEVVLSTGTPPAERKIAKADIASRTDPVSAMPPLGLILKPREVRDLVEFLAGMR